jgi:hypothetical protein
VLRQQRKEAKTWTLPQPESAVQVLIVHAQEVGNRKGMLEAGFGEGRGLSSGLYDVGSKGEDRVIQPPPFRSSSSGPCRESSRLIGCGFLYCNRSALAVRDVGFGLQPVL